MITRLFDPRQYRGRRSGLLIVHEQGPLTAAKQGLAMFGRSRSIRSRRGGCGSRVIRLAGMAAAAFWIFTIAAVDSSQACPKGSKDRPHEATTAAVVHQPAANMVFIASAPSSRPAKVDDFNCCGHCSGISSNGCCPACALALLAFNQTLMLEGVSYVYVLPFQAGFARSRPPPEFRPPRTRA